MIAIKSHPQVRPPPPQLPPMSMFISMDVSTTCDLCRENSQCQRQTVWRLDFWLCSFCRGLPYEVRKRNLCKVFRHFPR